MRQWEGPFPEKDPRADWVRPLRYRASIQTRSRGLVKAMRKFARLLGKLRPVEALRVALRLDDGPPTYMREPNTHAKIPIPEDIRKAQQEAWNEKWSDSLLEKVAADWQQDSIVRGLLGRKVKSAKLQLSGLAEVAVEVIADILQDAQVNPKVRGDIAKSVLVVNGIDGKPDVGNKLHDMTDKLRADARKALSEGGENSVPAARPRETHRKAG